MRARLRVSMASARRAAPSAGGKTVDCDCGCGCAGEAEVDIVDGGVDIPEEEEEEEEEDGDDNEGCDCGGGRRGGSTARSLPNSVMAMPSTGCPSSSTAVSPATARAVARIVLSNNGVEGSLAEEAVGADASAEMRRDWWRRRRARVGCEVGGKCFERRGSM